MRVIGLVLLLWTFCYGDVWAEGREPVVARKVTNSPKINGKLDDPVWKEGEWLTDFRLISGNNELAKVQTEFQIAYDEENLYVAARMYEPEPGKLKIEEYRRDGTVFRDDCFELMIDPYGDRYEYFHFIANAVEVQYDARQSCGGTYRDSGWNANWKVATKIGSNSWTIEMAIPFSELSIDKQSLGDWSFNVARQRWAGGKPERSSFGSMKGTFHVPEAFTELRLPEADLGRYLWRIKGPYSCDLEVDKEGWILTGKFRVKNLGSSKKYYKVIFKQVSRKASMIMHVLSDELSKGQEKKYVLRLPVERQDPLNIQVELVNAMNVKDIYGIKRMSMDSSFESINLQLLSPGYRNSIYPTEDFSEIRMNVKLALVSKILNRSTLRVRLLEEKSKKLVSELDVYEALKEQEVSLPIRDLNSGSYVLEVMVIGKNGDVIARTSEVIKKLKGEREEWRLGADGVLLHNGRPFLPKGWFKMLPEEMESTGEVPYNSIFIPKSTAFAEDDLEEYLDLMYEVGGHVVAYVYPKREMMMLPQLGRELTVMEMREIRQHVKRLKNHPAIMAWVIGYQPELYAVLPERLKQVYAVVAEEDPFHPCLILNSSYGGAEKYLGIADIAMVSPSLPFSKEGGMERLGDLTGYYSEVDTDLIRKKAAIWTGLQAYDYGNARMEDIRIPSFLELRNMLYQGIVGGSKGCFWYNYEYSYNFPEVRIGVDHLVQELKILEDGILEGIDEKMQVQSTDRSALRILQKVVGNEIYIIVVNSGDREQEVKFKVEGFIRSGRLHVLSENRSVAVDRDGRFEDRIAPYGVHVYMTKKSRGALRSLAEVEKLIDRKNRLHKKIGNFAFRDEGVKVMASSSSIPDQLNKVNDGVFEGLEWSSNKEEELPQWVELSWKKPVYVGKVVIYSDTIERAIVQVNKDGEWMDVAEFVRRSGAHLRATFKDRYTDKLRVLITAKKPGVDAVTLSEVEVYNSSTEI